MLSKISPTFNAKFISQQAQKNGFWLIQIELHQFVELAVGSRLIWEFEQAWLFQKQTVYLTLLSEQDWSGLKPNQDLTLEIRQPDLTFEVGSQQVWLGSDLSQAAVFDAAKRWQQSPKPKGTMMALLHATQGFAFQPKPAKFLLNMSPEAIGAAPLLEDWGVANRLASNQGFPGCLEGDIEVLYQAWLNQYKHQAWYVYGFLPHKQYQACLALSQNETNIQFQVQRMA